MSFSPSKSPWALATSGYCEKEGYRSARFYIDYRKLNAVTRKDSYPLPTIDNTLDTLAGSQWFSTLDLAVTDTLKLPMMIIPKQLTVPRLERCSSIYNNDIIKIH